MPLYSYTVISREGNRLTGEIEGVSRKSILEELHKLGHLPVDVREAEPGTASNAGTSPRAIGGNPSHGQITLFTRELSMLLRAGLSLDQALALLEKDSASRKLGRLVSQVRAQINEGKSFHEALSSRNAFPPIYVSMVRVAEMSGTLDTVLERIAETREREQKLRAKALSAILYPAILIVTAIAAVILMLTFIVPRFKEMILQAGTEIPRSAALIIGASDWLVANWEILLLALGAVLGSALMLWRRQGFRQWGERTLLKLPVIGNIMRLNLTVRFCRALGTLIENGVALPAALQLVRDVLGNRLAASALDEAHDALRKGRSFIAPLADAGLFPAAVINLLHVGEETGSLERSLFHLAEMFEEKLEIAVQRTFTILEPVIILLVSAFVALVIISILGAVISINDLAI